MAQGDNLAAFVVAAEPIDADVLLAYLAEQLPPYMVPSTVMQLEALPFNVSGKLDETALPAPEGSDYCAPRNLQEQQLQGIWQQVLGLKSIGVHANFFALGGNSIVAMKLCATISEQLDVDLPLALLFDCQTIASLAARLGETCWHTIDVVEGPDYPLAFAQQRLWFIEQFEQGTDAYHMPYLFELDQSVGVSELLSVIHQICQRHPVLTARFDDNHQHFGGDSVRLERKGFTEQTVRDDIARPFDLTQEIPLRVVCYDKGQQRCLLFVWHHIAFDGWSAQCFFKELGILLSGQETGSAGHPLRGLCRLESDAAQSRTPDAILA